MGLFDSIANTVLGKVMGSGQGGIADAASELLNENGGLSGILDKFKQSGFGDLAASWVGKGENLPISADQISTVLGSGTLASLAEKFGISPDTLSAQLAEHLPGMVDKVTPDGEVNAESEDMLSNILSALKK